jgi:hypothetical protein
MVARWFGRFDLGTTPSGRSTRSPGPASRRKPLKHAEVNGTSAEQST